MMTGRSITTGTGFGGIESLSREAAPGIKIGR